MSIHSLLEEEVFLKVPEERFQEVVDLELEEYLDNLGYISIDQNNPDRWVSKDEIASGIEQFRQEYEQEYPFIQLNRNLFKYAFPVEILGNSEANLLLEEELNLLSHLSSLEGKFDLNKFNKSQIKKSPLLSRVLNYRLSVLSLLPQHGGSVYSAALDEHLDQIGSWLGLKSYAKKILATGNIDFLAFKLCSRDSFPGSTYQHFVFFEDKARRLKGTIRSNKARFQERLKLISEESRDKFALDSKKKRKEFTPLMNDPLNILAARIVQIKLWLVGTYAGKLDNDIGPITIDAAKDLVEYLGAINPSVKKGITIADFIERVKPKVLALNTHFLLYHVFPIFIDKEELLFSEQGKRLDDPSDESTPEADPANTLSVELFDLGVSLGANSPDGENKELYELLEEQVSGKREVPPPKRKTKTRGGKGFLESVRGFFKKIGSAIKKGLQTLRNAIVNFFKWIKNGIQILIREIKKTFRLFKTAIAFLFSSRLIPTRDKDNYIVTDFDFDLDSITRFKRVDPQLIQAHMKKMLYLNEAIKKTSKFLGFCLFVVINMGKMGFGWLKIGIRIIKELAKNKLSAKDYSFTLGADLVSL